MRHPLAILSRLGRVALDAIQRFFADNCPQHAAGIAYRVLFSIAPLAIVLVSIFGLVLQDDSVRRDVVDSIVGWLPVSEAGRSDVEDAITAIATPVSAVGLISLFVFAWAATGMMGAIRQGLEAAMSVPESRPVARGKVVDLILIVGTAVLVLLSAGLTLLGDLVQRASGQLRLGRGPRRRHVRGCPAPRRALVLSVVVVMLLYRFVPARGPNFRAGLVGAIVTAALLQAIAVASGVIYDRTTRLSVVYGSLTAALVFLYSIYLYTSALLLGAEVATAWSRPPSTDTTPTGTRIKRLLLGFFVKQKPAHRSDDVRTSTQPPPRV